MNGYWWLLSIGAGVFVELLFQLLKFQDESEKEPPVPKYVPYDRYMSVQEFVASGRRRWGRYLFFRLLPPTLTFSLMIGAQQKYFPHANVWLGVFIAATISLLPRDLLALFRKTYNSFGEGFVHFIDIVSVYVVSLLLALLASNWSFAPLVPSRAGVIDNLWSTLFVALIVTFYNLASRAPQHTTYYERQNKLANYIIENYRKIERDFGPTINSATVKTACSKALLYAILIYENMNRPAPIRALERLIVRLTGKKLTVGIAQVATHKPISDGESIQKAARLLKNTDELVRQIYVSREQAPDTLTPLLHTYNLDVHYPSSVLDILSTLATYAPALFGTADQ